MVDTLRRPAPAGRRPRRPRAGRRILAIFLVLGVVGVGLVGATVGYVRWCEGASGPRTRVTVQIPPGTGGNAVIDVLHRHHVIRCDLVPKFLSRARGTTFLAGTYALTTNMTFDQALAAMKQGPIGPKTVRLTVPEGFRMTQIAARAASIFGFSAKRFLALAKSGSYSLPPYLPAKKPVEGFLFPATYDVVQKGATPDGVIRTMLDEFRKRVASLPWQNAPALGITPYAVVIVASMIEREARVPGDRAKIAAVIYNRLRRHMPLGIDATLRYVDPTPKDGLQASELHMKSPYNTRINVGLPPTPIASPGIPSLLAALEPANVDYLYYVLCGKDGHHAFATTLKEFINLTHRCHQ